METEVLLIKKRGRKPIKKVDVLDLPVIEKGVQKSTFITVGESGERTELKPSTDEVTLTDLNIERLEDHPYNNYPDDNPEDFLDLKKSLEYADFDARFPIWVRTDITDGKIKILDGKNRLRAINEINSTNPSQQIVPVFKEFKGTDLEALDFVERTNIRRKNLTSSQWAGIAAGAVKMRNVILAAVKEAKSEKLKGNQNAKKGKKIKSGINSAIDLPDKKEKNKRESRTKVAKTYNTNGKYYEEAGKLDDDKLKDLVDGRITVPDIIREKKAKAPKAKMTVVTDKKTDIPYQTFNDDLDSIPLADVVTDNDDLYETPLAEDIFEMIRLVRAEILDMEMNNPKGVLDAELIDKIQEVKYQLGHKLTKEKK